MRISNLFPLLSLFTLSLLIRLKYAGMYAESWDAVDFALGLTHYDIFDMRPHFPGYPLFILAGQLLMNLTSDPVQALTYLSALVGSLSLFPFFIIAKRITPDLTGAWAATILFASSPLLGLTHVSPMSEAMGMFFVLLFIAYLSRSFEAGPSQLLKISCISSFLFAATLGIRTSFFPVGFAILYPLFLMYQHKRTLFSFLFQSSFVALIFGCSVLAWLLPTAATEGGMLPYLELGKAFTVGHFTEWGGTSFSTETSWLTRIHSWMVDRLFFNGLLGTSAWTTAKPLPFGFVLLEGSFLLGVCFWGLISFYRKRTRIQWLFLLSAIPYALWMFFGQNSEKARHILPLLPWLFVFIGYGWSLLFKKIRSPIPSRLLMLCSGMVLFALFTRQIVVLKDHLLTEPPTKQLVTYIMENYNQDQTLVYTWEEQRLFDYYAPAFQTERLRSFPYFSQSLLLNADSHKKLLLTNAVLNGFGPESPFREHVREVARFSQDSFLYPTYHTVILYEIPQETIEKVKHGFFTFQKGIFQ